MPKPVEKVKRRIVYRRQTYAPGRYVRFEEHIDPRLVALSDETGVEVAELVRIAVDDLLDGKELTKALKMITKAADPKAMPAHPPDPSYVPLAELGIAQ